LESGQKAVGFRLGGVLERADVAGDGLDLVFSVGLERWNGAENVQLFLTDLRVSGNR
jgi:hypothetical protein